MQTEDMCPGTTDFKVMKDKKCAFEGVEGDIEIIGFPCPHAEAMKSALVKKFGDTITILDYTH